MNNAQNQSLNCPSPHTGQRHNLLSCYQKYPVILIEGAVGQRIEREFRIRPDPDVFYAGMIYEEKSREALATIYRQYMDLAQAHQLPILLMTNTRRANLDRVSRSNFRDHNLMVDYARFLDELRQDYTCPVFIGGMLGCKNDAYRGDQGLSIEEATAFHRWQIEQCRHTALDYLFAGIMPSLPETIAMAGLMADTGLPYIISLMIGRTGHLLDGTTIHDAIEAIDHATPRTPLCYMTNCVHPHLLREALSQPHNRTELVRARFQGIQANAVDFSPEALDHSDTLHTTPPETLADAYASLHHDFPQKLYGGCCGTDQTHLSAMLRRILPR